MKIVISCEHAGRNIPREYNYLFEKDFDVVKSHRGWDPGAWELSWFLSQKLKVPAYGCFTTRLLIEVNRSFDHPQLFSEFSSGLNNEEKNKLTKDIYLQYRNIVEEEITHSTRPTLHLSMHSFTPALDNEVRELEIGLLFDPQRSGEKIFCEEFLKKLSDRLPGYRIKFNEPYQGTDDGFTTYLRTRFDNDSYRGIEMEINQKLVNVEQWTLLKESIASCLMDYKFS